MDFLFYKSSVATPLVSLDETYLTVPLCCSSTLSVGTAVNLTCSVPCFDKGIVRQEPDPETGLAADTGVADETVLAAGIGL